jgi:hypothetical protein
MNRNIPAILAGLLLCLLLSSNAIYAQTNDGSSPEKAIKVINISNYTDCKDIKKEYKKSIDQEYNYHLPLLLGFDGKDWKVIGRRLITKDGKYYDQLLVALLFSKTEKILYFDVTEPVIKYREAYSKQKQK